MPTKLTEAQRVLLQAGAQREDRFIPAPTGSKSAAAKKSATRLIAEGLAKELDAKPGVPVWRIDGETGQSYALKLTAAGFETASTLSGQGAETNAEPLAKERSVESAAPSNRKMEPSGSAPSTLTTSPREGSKLAAVVTLLNRRGGVTIDELAKATGWLPHTTLTALTGLLKRGVCIDRIKVSNQCVSSYIVVDSEPQDNATQG